MGTVILQIIQEPKQKYFRSYLLEIREFGFMWQNYILASCARPLWNYYVYSVLTGPGTISTLRLGPPKLLFPRLYLPTLESHWPVWGDSQNIAQEREGQRSGSVLGTTPPCLRLALPDHAWPSLSKPWHLSAGLITLVDTQGECCSFTEQVGQKHTVKAGETCHPCTTNELQPWPKSSSECWTPGPYSHGFSWAAKENNHLWQWHIITISDRCSKDSLG